jgi:hypothetical protein
MGLERRAYHRTSAAAREYTGRVKSLHSTEIPSYTLRSLCCAEPLDVVSAAQERATKTGSVKNKGDLSWLKAKLLDS